MTDSPRPFGILVAPVIIDKPWGWGRCPAAPLITSLRRGLVALYSDCNPFDASVILLVTCDPDLERRARRINEHIRKFREHNFNGVFFLGVFGCHENEMPQIARRWAKKDIVRIYIEPTFDQIHRDATSTFSMRR